MTIRTHLHNHAPKYYLCTIILTTAAAATSLYTSSNLHNALPRPSKMSTTTTSTATSSTTPISTPYTATFSVPMHCTACTTTLLTALAPLPLTSTTFSLPTNHLTTTGTAPPSQILKAIQSTGRTAILRGTGKPNSAAVCILETPPCSAAAEGEEEEDEEKEEARPKLKGSSSSSPVRGLARLIELDERITLLDLTLTGMRSGVYSATVRETGDISGGVGSVGGVFDGLDIESAGEGGEEGQQRRKWRRRRRGELARVDVGADGRGEVVGEVGWRVWEMVGRGVVVERVGDELGMDKGEGEEERDGVVMGVVARSAGVWENEKVVCGCSGKTVWEEREEMVGRGMV